MLFFIIKYYPWSFRSSAAPTTVGMEGQYTWRYHHTNPSFLTNMLQQSYVYHWKILLLKTATHELQGEGKMVPYSTELGCSSMVTFPATEHHLPSTSTKLYCFMTDRGTSVSTWPGSLCSRTPMWSWTCNLLDRKSNAQHIAPLCHLTLMKTTRSSSSNSRRSRIIYSYTNDMPYINALYCACIPSLVDPSWTALSQVLYITLTTLILPSYPFTYSSGSYNYNSIKSCKQISTPPQPYQKISDIYFLRSCSLPNFISILSPITIQFVVDVFVLYQVCYFVSSIVLPIVLFGLTTTKLNKLYYYYK